eukprot:gene9180-12379_t
MSADKQLYDLVVNSNKFSNKLPEIEKLLQNTGANPNWPDSSKEGQTALMATKNKDIAELLIKYGANVNMQDDDGVTPLFYAAGYDSGDIAELLLKYGANINHQDKFGETALFLAIMQGYIGVVKTLLAYDASIHIKDKEGYSPLFVALRNDRTEVLKCLILYGGVEALDNIKDNEERTCLHWAACHEQNEIIKILLNANANPTVKCKNGRTPFEWSNHQSVILEEAERNWILKEEERRRATMNQDNFLHHKIDLRTIPKDQIPIVWMDIVEYTPASKPYDKLLKKHLDSKPDHLLIKKQLKDGTQETAFTILRRNRPEVIRMFFATIFSTEKSSLLSYNVLAMEDFYLWFELIQSKEELFNQNLIIENRILIDCLKQYPKLILAVSNKDENKNTLAMLLSTTLPLRNEICKELPLNVLQYNHYEIWFELIKSSNDPIKKPIIQHLLSLYPEELIEAHDANGRLALNFASIETRNLMKSLQLIHGKYRLIDERTTQHSSVNGYVYYALNEIYIDPKTHVLSPKRVALKLIRNKSKFLQEIKMRQIIFENNDNNDELVMPILETFPNLKPLHVVQIDGQWKIIDLTSAILVNKHKTVNNNNNNNNNNNHTCSMGYIAPEALHFDNIHKKMVLKSSLHSSEGTYSNDYSLDVWSLGCMIYQLCHYEGMPLFPLTYNDNISQNNHHSFYSNSQNNNHSHLKDLWNWSDDFKKYKLDSGILHPLAKNLLAFILHKDPSKRPNLEMILSHPFLNNDFIQLPSIRMI